MGWPQRRPRQLGFVTDILERRELWGYSSTGLLSNYHILPPTKRQNKFERKGPFQFNKNLTTIFTLASINLIYSVLSVENIVIVIKTCYLNLFILLTILWIPIFVIMVVIRFNEFQLLPNNPVRRKLRNSKSKFL